jgi:Tol biopolymer transport system component
MNILNCLMWVLLAAGMYPSEGAVSIEGLMSAPYPTELTASPDGRRIAWLMNEQGKRNLWCGEIPLLTPRRLTDFNIDDGQELSQIAWSPNSESILFVRGGAKNSAGEFPNPTSDSAGTVQSIWIVPFAGGMPRKLASGTDPNPSATG